MPVKCQICGRQIANQGALNAHMLTHKSNNPASQKNFSFSYNGSKRNSENHDSSRDREKRSGSPGALIFLLIIIALVVFWISPWFNKAAASGVLETKGGKLIKPFFSFGEAVKDSLFNTFSTISKFASGEYQFSLESDVEERVKSGLEFGELKISGVEFGGLNKDLRVDTSIIVGKLDSELEKITAVVSCNLGPENVNGIPGGAVGVNGEIELENPGELAEYEHEGIKCSFPHEKITLAKKVNLKEAEIMLTYTLSPDFTLEVYGTKEKISESEKEKLLRGEYDRVAKMRYITDVIAKMHFSDKKPLVVGDTKILGMQFENKNIRRNKVALEKFFIALPENGLRIQDGRCEPLEIGEINNAAVWKMKDDYIKEINKQLNEDDGETDLYECEIKAPDKLGSVSDVALLGKIKGKIVVTNTISKKQDVTIYKKDEPVLTAEQDKGESKAGNA